jgi:indolepyruvate ferredoxin oxidoreductase
LRFAAGAERVETLDAQSLAESFLGDSIVSNILALGYAWQRGLVPVSLEALMRAIDLNGVGVENNRLAFSLGRLAAADPRSVQSLLGKLHADPIEDETVDSLIARGIRHLTGYQDAAYAQRYAQAVATARRHEQALQADPSLPFTRTVAQSLLKLMAYKDEYEVARLYTDGDFALSLHEQFEGDIKLEFYMAPPAFSRARNGRPPRKIRLGGWMLPVMKLLAKGRRLRGTVLDVFGRTQERRMERELAESYRRRIEGLLPSLTGERLKVACEIAALPLQMRGFGHVKVANVAMARAREAELLHRFDPDTYPRPAVSREAGQIRGIRVTAAAH